MPPMSFMSYLNQKRRRAKLDERDSDALIDRIVARRKSLNITQTQLAELAGLKQSNIARFERKAVAPNLETIFKVLHALGCTLEIVPMDQ